MADEKISQLTAKTTIDTADLLVMVDNGTATTKKITGANHKTTTLGQLENLTNAEISQLENIDTQTISNAQWGFVGAMNQSVSTLVNVAFKNITSVGTLTTTGAGKIAINRTVAGTDSFIDFSENGINIGRISGDSAHSKLYLGSDDQSITTPWIAFYDATGNVGINTAAASVPEKLTITAGNLKLDNNFSFLMSNAAVSANASIKMTVGDVLSIDNPSGNITIAPTTSFKVDTLTTSNGIVQTSADGTFSSSVTLPNGTLTTTQAPADNSTKLATTAYVDASTATANEFSELTDVSGAYTTGGALYIVTPSVDGLTESTVVVTQPAANQFTLTRGTSAFVVQGDLTVESTSLINQDLTSDANPTFADLTLTGDLLLPTTGGTATDLDYYEEGTHNTTWGGIWASAQTGNISFVRIGKMVTLTLPSTIATATVSNFITITTVLPATLRPAATLLGSWHVQDNNINKDGRISIDSAGTISFSNDVTGTAFVGSGGSGFRGFTINYVVA